MSFELMSRVWNTKCGSPASKLVLAKLAENANGEQNECWPSISTMARQCELSRQGVLDQIQKLENSGLIFVVRSTGGKASNRYRIFPAVNGVDRMVVNGVDQCSQPGGLQQSTAHGTAVNAIDSNRKEPVLNRKEPRANVLSVSWFDPDEDPEVGRERRWAIVKTWVEHYQKMGIDCTEADVRRSWMKWEGKGWQDGNRQVHDPRSAVGSTIWPDRKVQTANSSGGGPGYIMFPSGPCRKPW